MKSPDFFEAEGALRFRYLLCFWVGVCDGVGARVRDRYMLQSFMSKVLSSKYQATLFTPEARMAKLFIFCILDFFVHAAVPRILRPPLPSTHMKMCQC